MLRQAGYGLLALFLFALVLGSDQESPTDTEQWAVDVPVAIVRAGPSTETDKIGRVPKGTELGSASKIEGNWAQFAFPATDSNPLGLGWIRMDLLWEVSADANFKPNTPVACMKLGRVHRRMLDKIASAEDFSRIASKWCDATEPTNSFIAPEVCSAGILRRWRKSVSSAALGGLIGVTSLAIDECVRDGFAKGSYEIGDCIDERQLSLMDSANIEMNEADAACKRALEDKGGE